MGLKIKLSGGIIMNDKRFLEAKQFMMEKHEGQQRKNGDPYSLHPIAVSHILEIYGFDINYQIVGLFHDLLEDTNATIEQIKYYSNDNIAHAVQLLTKVKGYIMDEYLYNISQNELAKMPKLADRLDNMNPITFKTLDWSFRKE